MNYSELIKKLEANKKETYEIEVGNVKLVFRNPKTLSEKLKTEENSQGFLTLVKKDKALSKLILDNKLEDADIVLAYLIHYYSVEPKITQEEAIRTVAIPQLAELILVKMASNNPFSVEEEAKEVEEAKKD